MMGDFIEEVFKMKIHDAAMCVCVWVCVNLLRINAMDIKENIPYISSKCEWDLK